MAEEGTPPAKVLQLTSATPLVSVYNAIRLDESVADVILLVGEERKPIYAHANILIHGSEYYKNALSGRWDHQNLRESLEGVPVDSNKFLRAVLSHPDVDVETINIILEFIYTGSATVPESCLSRVAVFADFLTMEVVKKQCLDYWAMIRLSEANALDFYLLAKTLDSPEYESRALLCVKGVSALAGNGMDILKAMDEVEIRELLSFKEFTPLTKWILLINWVKLKQGFEVGCGFPQHFNFEIGVADLAPLISLVGLFKMDAQIINHCVRPYWEIIPPLLQNSLTDHFELDGSAEQWLEPLSSCILTQDALPVFLHRIAEKLSKRLSSWNLLFRTSPLIDETECDNEFHKACNGHGNTVLLLKTTSGAILGAFADTAWDNFDKTHSAKEAFLFSVQISQSGSISDIEFYMPVNIRHAIGIKSTQNHVRGPSFGGSLYVKNLKVASKWGSSYHANDKSVEFFLGENQRDKSKIKIYEVFKLHFEEAVRPAVAE
ncbi:hypothetical protein BCR33DRAFT_847796 [Rhizoclosmatium globosum]|uniref:BTB domain-containing protein n=1 Tax=Rhizoclosmatium globosum TaxID=329046 RepID=A0A1Y2CQ42_9FUNG|nr:hypothetical protein BCR33DRAFT_847796 [Rhizoclosmatium globosum]|eukprot:ORY49142.1 hypothetical protein BCR33DRAFT_847796 [Rhizoclosmatium globosum]